MKQPSDGNDRWIVRGRTPKAARARILCFPHAGGTAAQFRAWDALAPADVEFVGVQFPGRELRFREPAFRAMDALVAAMAPALAEHLDRPFAIFGHSLGALVAFEFTRWLRRAGLPLPQHLFVASRPAPQLPYRYDPVHDLPEEQLLDILRLYGGTAEEMLSNREMMRIFLPTIRADLAVNRTYVYYDEPPLSCPITALHGERDPIVDDADMRGWVAQTSAAFRADVFDGGHFFVHQHIPTVAGLILAELGVAAQDGPGRT